MNILERLFLVWAAVLFLLWSPALTAQISFNDVASQSGFTVYEPPGLRSFGSGIAAADYDDDGDVDLFVPTEAGTPDRLYRNLGNGQFEEIGASVGLSTTIHLSRVALWIDYNADGRLDLLVAGDCYLLECQQTASFLRLYRQTESGSFENVTTAAGLYDDQHTSNEHRSGMAAGDLNRDGFLDFVAGFWDGRLQLYLNQGNGTFTDVSVESGLGTDILAHHQPVILDLDGDGLLDIFSAIDFTENRLWINQGNLNGIPTFTETAAASNGDNAMNDMGVAVGDFDGDQDPDLYVTNIFRENQYNILLENSLASAGAFAEVSQQAGVRDGGWGWGTTFLDVDNNGYLDLAETNGWHFGDWRFGPIRLFIHQQNDPGTFVDQAATAGLTGLKWGSALLSFDYDLDGDVDLIHCLEEGAIELLQNQLDRSSGDRHYLLIRPRMIGRNVQAIGARVVVEVGGKTMSRWITAGSSYLGQEPSEAFFGLASQTSASRVEVHWPNGGKTVLTNVAADQVLTITNEVFTSDFESGGLGDWSP